jgi:hypothetical protein
MLAGVWPQATVPRVAASLPVMEATGVYWKAP